MTKSDHSGPPDSPPRRETTHLPLRAGAMLLLAIAVLFIGLGWHSAATSGSDPEAGLQAAQSRQSTSAVSGTSAASTATATSTATSSAPVSASTSTSADPNRPEVCVFNAGTISGLGQTFTKKVDDLGWETAEPTNLQSASITENTIFYSARQQDEAEQLAKDLGGDVSVDPRPSAFTECQGGLPLIVVSR